MPSARSFLIRGLLAGLIAGIFAFGVAYVVGEPSRRRRHRHRGVGRSHDPRRRHRGRARPPTSRRDRGAPFPAVHGRTADRAPSSPASRSAVWSACSAPWPWAGSAASASAAAPCWSPAIGFVSVYVVPFVGYPPNPPAVGAARHHRPPDRAVLHPAGHLGDRRRRRRAGRSPAGRPLGSLVRGAGRRSAATVVVLGRHRRCCPTYDEVPADFPATRAVRVPRPPASSPS